MTFLPSLAALGRLLYRTTVLILLSLIFYVSLWLMGALRQDNQIITALRQANLQMQVENGQLYDELAKVVAEKVALEEELYKARTRERLERQPGRTL